jgi:hypothetical protein
MTTFALDLNRAIEKAKDKAEIAVRKITIDLFKSVIMKSPVDTGRFRANWNTAIGTADYSTSTETDKSGSTTLSNAASVVASYKLSESSIFLTNNLPYAGILEFGRANGKPGSNQAPNGMVRLSMMEVSRKYGA